MKYGTGQRLQPVIGAVKVGIYLSGRSDVRSPAANTAAIGLCLAPADRPARPPVRAALRTIFYHPVVLSLYCTIFACCHCSNVCLTTRNLLE